jgi:hypothetical protein
MKSRKQSSARAYDQFFWCLVGVGSLADIDGGGTFESVLNLCDAPDLLENDEESLAGDWRAVGADLRAALQEELKEMVPEVASYSWQDA